MKKQTDIHNANYLSGMAIGLLLGSSIPTLISDFFPAVQYQQLIPLAIVGVCVFSSIYLRKRK
jgi:hypothetical protein